MNFSYTKTLIDNNTIKYQFYQNNKILNYSDFINLLKGFNSGFIKYFCNTLQDANSQFSAYFWECPPVSQKNLNQPFEFVVIKNEQLANISQNYQAFKNYFEKNESHDRDFHLVTFPNLGGDAILFVPIPYFSYKSEELFFNWYQT